MTSQVLFNNPDIMGVQEARPHQMADIKSMFKTHNSIGIGRDGNDKGEYSAIFYNSTKLKVESENTFWLSETPNIFSKGWDAAYPRICTYGLFTRLEDGKKFWVFNTHLDHKGVESQLEGMKLILEKIGSLNTKQLSVILMGDFNVQPSSKLIMDLRTQMKDSKTDAKIVFGPNGTFNAFNFEELVKNRIDYIFVSKSNIEVEEYGVLSSSIDMRYPSDHFPVIAHLFF